MLPRGPQRPPAEPLWSRRRRDLEDMRLELCQERAKRQALQVGPWRRAVPMLGSPPPPKPHSLSPQAEIERVRKVLPC